jgi:hypothetical protein
MGGLAHERTPLNIALSVINIYIYTRVILTTPAALFFDVFEMGFLQRLFLSSYVRPMASDGQTIYSTVLTAFQWGSMDSTVLRVPEFRVSRNTQQALFVLGEKKCHVSRVFGTVHVCTVLYLYSTTRAFEY